MGQFKAVNPGDIVEITYVPPAYLPEATKTIGYVVRNGINFGLTLVDREPYVLSQTGTFLWEYITKIKILKETL